MPQNLLAVRQHLQAAEDLDPIAKRDMLSAVKVAAEALGSPLEMIPTDPQALRPLLEKSSFGRRGLSHRRWSNVRSSLRRALQTVGVLVRERETAPLISEWLMVLEPLPKKTRRMAIVPFARWCSAQQIAPTAVCQKVADRYLYEMEAFDLRFGRREAFCQLVRAWNKAGVHSPAWPKVILAIQCRRNWYTRPFDDFPDTLRCDVESMLSSWQSPDFDDDTGPEEPIGFVTAARYRARIRALASALVESGWDSADIRSLSDLVVVDAFRASLDYVINRNGGDVNDQALLDAAMLCAIAKHWVQVSASHLMSLKKRQKKLRKLHPKKRKMTKKNQETIRIFDNDRMIEKFLDLPEQLVRTYGSQVAENKRARMAIERALAIKILTHAPVRAKNLSAIKLGENLIEMGRGRLRRLFLHFDAREVKNGVDLEFELPRDVFKLLDLYVQKVRPVLVRCPTPYLFPNTADGPKLSSAFSQQIAREVKRQLGVRLTAHQFRHLVIFIFLRDNPGGIEIARLLLGHENVDTTNKSYAGLEARHAIRAFDQLLTEKRSQLRGRRRRG